MRISANNVFGHGIPGCDLTFPPALVAAGDRLKRELAIAEKAIAGAAGGDAGAHLPRDADALRKEIEDFHGARAAAKALGIPEIGEDRARDVETKTVRLAEIEAQIAGARTSKVSIAALFAELRKRLADARAEFELEYDVAVKPYLAWTQDAESKLTVAKAQLGRFRAALENHGKLAAIWRDDPAPAGSPLAIIEHVAPLASALTSARAAGDNLVMK